MELRKGRIPVVASKILVKKIRKIKNLLKIRALKDPNREIRILIIISDQIIVYQRKKEIIVIVRGITRTIL